MKQEIRGNISGIRNSILEEMQKIYDYQMHRAEFISQELFDDLVRFTQKLGREIAVVISRDGKIQDVSIGDADSAQFAQFCLTRSEKRLCGVRCIHTHPSGSANLSNVDCGTLIGSKLDAMCAIGVNGENPKLCCGFLGEKADDIQQLISLGPVSFSELNQSMWMDQINESEKIVMADTDHGQNIDDAERAILVGLDDGKQTYNTLEELAQLVETAGATVIGFEKQKKDHPDNACYVGKGKLAELSKIAAETNANLFVFDDELSAVQLRNIESAIGVRVIDRTTLILHIFAIRAQSREGKMQVELAQLKYRLPRLIGSGGIMAKLNFGIGMRGPGEKKLEMDRRRIRRQIFELEKEIDLISKQRAVRRARREKNAIPQVALVGYTNAGKSTLLNLLSQSDVLAKDMLFATLDPVTRQIDLPELGEALLSDTVGFINKLPHDLVQAFRSTLDEAIHADVIVHVVDASAENAQAQMKVVDEVLGTLEVGDTPIIIAFNKVDRCTAEQLSEIPSDALKISAKKNLGIDELLQRIAKELGGGYQIITYEIPYNRAEVAAYLKANALILEEEYQDQVQWIRAKVNAQTYGTVKKMLGTTER